MSKKPLQQSQAHASVYPDTREAVPKIVQAKSIEVSRRANPLPDLLQANERLPSDPAGKHKGVSRHPRQCAHQIKRGQSNRDVPSADLAVGQAKDVTVAEST